MDTGKIIAGAFTIVFIAIIYYFILKTLRLMKKDIDNSDIPVNAGPDAPWALKVVQNNSNRRLKVGLVIPLTNGMTMGRKGDNNIVMDDPYVSFYHLRFFKKGGRFIIEDLESTNGTLLNNEKLKQKTYLRINDTITVGSTIFRVVL